MLSLTYLEGIPLNDHDLKRALTSEAKAVFIMTNKFSTNPDEEDAKTILQQFSIQRYLKLHANAMKQGGVGGSMDDGSNDGAIEKVLRMIGLSSLIPYLQISTWTGRGSSSRYRRSYTGNPVDDNTGEGENNGNKSKKDDENNSSPSLLFCMQLIRPENKRHLVSASHHSGGGDDVTSGNDLVICLNEIKMGVIAKACIFPVSCFRCLLCIQCL
jgi:hypothetical protein